MINRYTVIGQPIAHSVSPDIHHVFGELTQRRILYTRTEATADTFADTVQQFTVQGGLGCNVTMPFKSQALNVVDRIKPCAERAGALNTIFLHKDGSLIGFNTDGSGLLADLKNTLRVDPVGLRALMVGAGGAARGVLGPLIDAQPKSLVIANRTVAKAEALVEQFKPSKTDHSTLLACSMDTLDNHGPFDLVINATSSSLTGNSLNLPDNLFSARSLAYDMVYSNTDTAFMTWANEHGAGRVVDGFGMLVEQAADAYLIWQGVRPKTRLVYPRLTHLRNIN